jgi:hypothetical protein
MIVLVADAHAHVQTLVSLVKMATVHEEYITEEHRCVVRFCGQKNSMQRIFIRKCFLFNMGGVCRVQRVTAGWQTFLPRRSAGETEHARDAYTRVTWSIWCVI